MILKNLKEAFKKEFFIYMAMLLILTVLMHSDILMHPASRFQFMIEKENYTHPFLYTAIIYTVFFIIRKILDLIIGLFEKK
jgi:hypothetical protein